MSKVTAFVTLVTASMLFGVGGSCLPANFWSDKLGEITNGLIIGVLNLFLTPATGITI